MEMELGLKLTRIADEFTSDFQIANDRAGPLFLSRETDSMFILTAHLKSYKRRNIKIDINEDGTLIAINGEKQVKETVMVGWKVVKKDTEIKGFKKVFRIPDGVILDKIKAKFNEDESTLTITMPKKAKGIRGTPIEEIKEKHQELVKEGSSNLQIFLDEKSQSNAETSHQKSDQTPDEDEQIEKPVLNQEKEQENHLNEKEVIEEIKSDEMAKEGVGNQKSVDGIEEISDPNRDQEPDLRENNDHVHDGENDIHEEEKRDEEKEEHNKPRGKRCKMCIPIVAGSTLLLSFVVFVIQIVRSRNQTSRRRD